MSASTNEQAARVRLLHQLFRAIIQGAAIRPFYDLHSQQLNTVTPCDLLQLLDEMLLGDEPAIRLQPAFNKLLNLLHEPLANNPMMPFCGANHYLGILLENDRLMQEKLYEVKLLLGAFNREPESRLIKQELFEHFVLLKPIATFYLIKEKLLFPLLEKRLPEFTGIAVMWSFYDDIYISMKRARNVLKEEETDLAAINKAFASFFFTIYTIRCREECLLFPLAAEFITDPEFDQLLDENITIGFPYYQPEKQLSTHIYLATLPRMTFWRN